MGADPQQLQRQERRGHPETGDRREREHLAQVGREQEPHAGLRVGVDGPAFLHRRDDRCEIVIGKYLWSFALG
jgi:hypothetical protein